MNRPLGRQFAALTYRIGLTPNQISLISAACSYTSIALIAILTPTWPVAALIAALLVVGYALDSADGQVARLRGGGSPAGEWLDHVLDAVKVSSFHLAVCICWYRHYGDNHRSWLLLPVAYAVVAAVFFFAVTLSDMLRRIASLKAGGSSATTATLNPNEPAPVLRSLLVLPNDYGLLCLVTLLLPAHDVFATVYTVLLAANAAFLLAGCRRWFREMSRLPAAT